MAAAVGSIVKLYYDGLMYVNVFDVLKTKTGRMYFVLETRKQTKGKHVGRNHLKCQVVDSLPEGHGTIHPLYWYRRKSRKAKSK